LHSWRPRRYGQIVHSAAGKLLVIGNLTDRRGPNGNGRESGPKKVPGGGSTLRPAHSIIASALVAAELSNSGDLAVREQPEDEAQRQQADKAVGPEVLDEANDVADDVAKERQVRADQKRCNNG